jgi:hypothetical protein
VNISTPEIRDLGNRFISIDFPSELIINSLGAELRKRYQDNILIINMSERDYDVGQLPGHVLTVNFRGMPSPPLELTCRLCLQMYQWLSRSPANVVAIHCFPGLSRTAVLMCSYLAWSGRFVHPVDALIDVCGGLKIDVESNPILPSQKRYLNYFFDFLTTPVPPAIPAKSLGITKLILNGVPSIPVGEDASFRPFIEIWKEGHSVYSSLSVGNKEVKGYPISDGDLCVASFDDFTGICISGDILFRVRHLTSNGGRFTCLRFAFNTNYVSNNMVHFGQFELDGNASSNCMIDVMFNPDIEPVSVVSDEFDRIRDTMKRAKEVSEKLRHGCEDISETGSDIEEIFKQPKKDVTTEPPEVIGKSSGANESPRRELGNASSDPGTSCDDVDDFFAQLEKDAQI